MPFIGEAIQLYRIKTNDISGQALGTVKYLQRVESVVCELTGLALEGQRVLNIGCGQVPREVMCLGMKNRVTAIDLDVIPQGFDIPAYWKMLRRNGTMRTLKTVARKALGVDRQYVRHLKRHLGTDRPPQAKFLQMNAENMTFQDGIFDFIYSFSVFEHLPDPKKVIDEAVRVMQPGAVSYISLHLYASEGGCHDMRIFAKRREMIPYWAQLRPEHRDKVQPNAYMNEIRIGKWREMFREKMPGCFFSVRHARQRGSRVSPIGDHKAPFDGGTCRIYR